MAIGSVILLVLYGLIFSFVIVLIVRKILTRWSDERDPDCYTNLFLDILLQTVIFGDSLIASILITDQDFASITTRGNLVIVFSSINFALIIFLFIFPTIEPVVHPAKRIARQTAYDDKVKEIRKAQLKMMQHHNKARRTGMKDVANPGVKLYKPKEMYAKGSLNQLKTRVKKSEIETNKVEPQTEVYSDPFRSRVPVEKGTSTIKTDPTTEVLPDGWKTYYNNDGVPYYYNSNTGETSWRHPGNAEKNTEPAIPSMNAPRPMESVEVTKENKPETKETKILIIPTITRDLIQFYKRWPGFIFGLVDLIFDIIVACALLVGIVFSTDSVILIGFATYIGVFTEVLVLCNRIQERFVTFERVQKGEWTGLRLLGFIVLVEFIGCLFECSVGLYLVFGVIGNVSVALVVCGAILEICLLCCCVCPTLKLILRGVSMSNYTVEPIYRDK